MTNISETRTVRMHRYNFSYSSIYGLNKFLAHVKWIFIKIPSVCCYVTWAAPAKATFPNIFQCVKISISKIVFTKNLMYLVAHCEVLTWSQKCHAPFWPALKINQKKKNMKKSDGIFICLKCFFGIKVFERMQFGWDFMHSFVFALSFSATSALHTF